MTIEIMDVLQEKVVGLIEMITTLKKENQVMRSQRDDVEEQSRLLDMELKQQKEETEKLRVALEECQKHRRETEGLREERVQIRERIEKILADLDQSGLV